jgi:hypothetical protein
MRFRIVGRRGRQWDVRRLFRKVGRGVVVSAALPTGELLSVPGLGEMKIGSAYTSQTCHACGHRAAESRESQVVFRCRACGHADHADVNAAKNIAAGRAVTAREALQPLGGAANREPQPVLSSA